MAIIGTNATLNQYVPTFYIKNIKNGQTVIYDSTKKAFVNADANLAGSGATRLAELLDVADRLDNPLLLSAGQALTYNTLTSQWENSFVDYNTLQNKPTNNSYSFLGLSDTNNTAVGNGYVKWNSAGTELIYSTTIPSSDVSGLSIVAVTGSYNDLLDKPTLLQGPAGDSAYQVAVANGFVGTETAWLLSLIGPQGLQGLPGADGAVGPQGIPGANGLQGLPGATGDSAYQVAVANGFVGTETAWLLSLIGPQGLSGADGGIGPQGLSGADGESAYQVAVANGFVGTETEWLASLVGPAGIDGTGSVQSVSVVSANGISGVVADPTTTPAITLTLGDITPTSIVASGTIVSSNISGVNTGDQTFTITGDATGFGTETVPLTLNTVNLAPGTYADSHFVPTITVNNKGLVTEITTQHVDTSVRDLIEDTLVINTRHQYIVTSRLEVTGRIENYGRIAIL